MLNNSNLELELLIYDNTKKVKDFFENEIVNKINSNNLIIDTALSEKIIQVHLKSDLPLSPAFSDNLYIVYGDTKENNGQYRWNGNEYEKISIQLDYATKVEAEVGADNTKVMTPLKVREFFIANGGGSGGVTNVVFQSGKKYYKFNATDVINSFEIPSELFNPINDVVELIHGGNIPLIKDENYTLVGNLITFIGYSLNIGDDIHCLITNTSYNYDALSNKPDLSLKQDKTDSNLTTTNKTIVEAINENKTNIDIVSVNMEQKANKTDALIWAGTFAVSGDLNTANQVNKWYDISDASGILNLPPYLEGWVNNLNNSALYVFGQNENAFTHIFFSPQANMIFTRKYCSWQSPQWTQWQEIATSTDLEQKADKEKNVLNLYLVANQTELDTALNSYSINLTNGTEYNFRLNVGFGNSSLGSGGMYYISGFKSDPEYEIQEVRIYNNHGLTYKQRSKYENIWEDWKTIAITDRTMKVDNFEETGGDFNTLVTPGVYRIQSTPMYINAPPNYVSYGQVLVLRGYYSDTCTQIATGYNTNRVAIRSGIVGTNDWTEWETIATTKTIEISSLPFAEGFTDYTLYGQRTHYTKNSLGLVKVYGFCQFSNTEKIDWGIGKVIAYMPNGYKPKDYNLGSGYVLLGGATTQTQCIPVSIGSAHGVIAMGNFNYTGTNHVLIFSIEYYAE